MLQITEFTSPLKCKTYSRKEQTNLDIFIYCKVNKNNEDVERSILNFFPQTKQLRPLKSHRSLFCWEVLECLLIIKPRSRSNKINAPSSTFFKLYVYESVHHLAWRYFWELASIASFCFFPVTYELVLAAW